MNVRVSASDFKGGRADADINVFVFGDYLDSSLAVLTDVPDLRGASLCGVHELLDALRNGIYTMRLMGDYQNYITRDEFCELIMVFFHVTGGDASEVSTENPFYDAESLDIITAYNLGIINGKAKNRFEPDSLLTRQEMCVMITRTLKLFEPDILNSVSVDGIYIADDDLIDSWAYEEVFFCNAAGIMRTNKDKIDPLGILPREQAIILLNRMYNYYIKNFGDTPEDPELELNNESWKSRCGTWYQIPGTR